MMASANNAQAILKKNK